MMPNARRRVWIVALWAFLPLGAGAVSGAVASQALWNYPWRPPVVTVGDDTSPQALAFFHFSPHSQTAVFSDAHGLREQLQRCGLGEDCTYGRALQVSGGAAWLSVGPLPETRAVDALSAAHRLLTTPFCRGEEENDGVVAEYVSNGKRLQIVGCRTPHEIANDTYGYAEALLRLEPSGATLEDAVHYYYDVAGIEFASPGVLAACGILLAYICAGLVLAGLRLRRGVA